MIALFLSLLLTQQAYAIEFEYVADFYSTEAVEAAIAESAAYHAFECASSLNALKDALVEKWGMITAEYQTAAYSANEWAQSGYSSDFKSAGVVYEDGVKFTWYSQRVLPGSGLTELNANGRHVGDDGLIRDADGYIAVASSDYAKGEVVQTPWGEAKVYDTGCDSGVIDVYTDY